MGIEIVDPITDYVTMMERLVDFDRIRALFASGFRLRFDAMHAVTGPYATAILQDRLGAPAGTWSMRRRCPISAATTPIQIPSMRRGCSR